MSFDRLTTSGNELIPFVVNPSIHSGEPCRTMNGITSSGPLKSIRYHVTKFNRQPGQFNIIFNMELVVQTVSVSVNSLIA
jgi:hypothetical protein